MARRASSIASGIDRSGSAGVPFSRSGATEQYAASQSLYARQHAIDEVEIGERVEPQARGAVEDGDVDALRVHVDEAGLRVGRAVALRRGRLDPLGHPRPAARSRRDDVAVEQVSRGPPLVVHEPRAPVEERGVEVLLPEPVGLEHVTVEVDHGRCAHRAVNIAPRPAERGGTDPNGDADAARRPPEVQAGIDRRSRLGRRVRRGVRGDGRRVGLGRRARRRRRRLRAALPVFRRRPYARPARHRHARPARVAQLHRLGDRDRAARHERDGAPVAQPRRARQARRDPRLPLARPRDARRRHRLAGRGVRRGGRAVRRSAARASRSTSPRSASCGARTSRRTTACSSTSSASARSPSPPSRMASRS